MEWVIDIGPVLDGLKPEGRSPERRVLLSPELGSASHLAVGLSVFGPHAVAERHSHPAEEVGYVLSGGGIQTVGEVSEEIRAGSVTHVGPGLEHQTTAGPEGIVQVWVYAPAGSEKRWMGTSESEEAIP